MLRYSAYAAGAGLVERIGGNAGALGAFTTSTVEAAAASVAAVTRRCDGAVARDARNDDFFGGRL